MSRRRGRVGLLVPSGIATDNTTHEFFAALMDSKALVSLHDFENRLRIFPDVDGRFKFCTLVFGGSQIKSPAADFVFFACHRMSDLEDEKRHIALSSKDIALLNPNTRTCPIFRTRSDAELTKAIYQRVPILIDESRQEGGNPWGIRFVTMFHQTNDAELSRRRTSCARWAFRLEGNRWIKGKTSFLPLYEAKMIQAYDHRAASVKIEAGNWVRQRADRRHDAGRAPEPGIRRPAALVGRGRGSRSGARRDIADRLPGLQGHDQCYQPSAP